MKPHALALLAALSAPATVSVAATIRLACENWHPRMGQVNDVAISVDTEKNTCNGQPCKITDDEFKWSEQGDRYEWVVNRKTGIGHIYFTSSSEKTAIAKSCGPSDK